MSAAPSMPTATPPISGQSPDGLPLVVVNGRELRHVTSDVVNALVGANDPPFLFTRAGSLVRVTHDERDRPRIEDVGPDQARNRISEVANFARVTKTGSTTAVYPPPEVARDLLARPNHPFPELRGITEVPVLRHDGTVLDEIGYDTASRLIYRPDPDLRVPPITWKPAAGEVATARDLVAETLVDFPFVDDSSRAAAWAMLLTPVVRPAIDGPVPLALIDAPTQGTGKTLLAKLASTIATGREPATMTAARDEEEWRKRITAVLAEAPTLILLDNVELPLRSEHLAAAITSDEWIDRRLGHTSVVRIPQRAVWFATGNNVAAGGDMQRRIYLCRMDARVERPWERGGFRHPDLLRWTREHRGELVAALLTLGRAWAAAERPAPGDDVAQLGSFEAWRHVVGGVLRVAQIPGFLANQAEAQARVDTDTEDFARFLRTWSRNYGSEPVPLAAVTQSREMIENLPSNLDPDDRGFRRRLGWMLRKNAERRFGGLWIERAGDGKEGVLWRLMGTNETAGQSLRSIEPGL